MKRLSLFVLRYFYLVMIRITERELNDQMTALASVRSVNDFKRISLAASETRQWLAHYRAEYTALMPVGVRQTWRIA